MSPIWPVAALAIATIAASVAARVAIRDAGTERLRPNHAGKPVPVVLGAALVRAAVTVGALALLIAALAGPTPRWDLAGLVLAGMLVLAGAGTLDDRSPAHARGIGGHLGSLARGRPTTGLLKLVAGVGVALAISFVAGGGAARVVASTLAISLGVNVWNALDVRPGRALKWGIAVLAVAVAVGWGDASGLVAAAVLGAAAGCLPADVGERAMLGDTGSNPLGLAVAATLVLPLPLVGVVLVAIVLGALQVAAETFTISRVIEAAPPLRWLDRLGRR